MKPYPKCEDYLISENGDVFSLKSNKFLKPWKDSKGYLQLELRIGGKRCTRKVHRLVAETFIPNPYNLPEVNHKDENKENPNVSNLEWCDTKYNCNYGTRTDRISESNRKSSLRDRKAIIQFDMQGNFVRELDAIERVKDYGIAQPNVVAVLKGRRQSANGFYFKYKEDYENELSFN